MSAKLGRRTFTKRAGAIAMAAALPMPAIAQDKPVKIGLLTVKTGPLAQGGIQMEQGINLFLKDRNYTLAGRKVELVVGDTGGNPAGTKTKAQELIERDHVDMIFGPLAAFELLAITDYVAQAKMPDPEPRRRRGHDPAQAQPVLRARLRHLGAEHASAGRLRGQGAEVQARDHRSPRISPSATSRWAASSGCSRTPAAGS